MDLYERSLEYEEALLLVTMGHVQPMNDGQKQQLLDWVDEAPITRDKRNLAKDMSDAGKRRVRC